MNYLYHLTTVLLCTKSDSGNRVSNLESAYKPRSKNAPCQLFLNHSNHNCNRTETL